MAFKFGTLSTSTKATVLSKSEGIDNYILFDHFDPQEEEYYLFLLEGMPEKQSDLEMIKKRIAQAGYSSYVIAAATNTIFKKAEVKQQYEYMKSTASNWKNLIDYNGVHVTAIMAFGAALYSINRGTDLIANEFYETKMMKPYYYLGHGFIGDYDTFIFPVDSMDALYPKEFKKGCPFAPGDPTENFKTRFFYEQLKNMRGPKVLPDDMRGYKIVAARDFDSAKEILTKLLRSQVLAFDTETDSLLWYRQKTHIHCFTFSNDGETGYYIESKVVFESPELRDLLCKVFYSCNTVVGANIKFDFHFLMDNIPEFDFYKVKHIDDTGQLIHAINSDIPKGLKPSAFRYTPFGGYDDELDIFKKQTKVSNYSLIPFEILHKYATLDAIVTYRIFMALEKEIMWVDEHFPNEKNAYLPDHAKYGMKRWYDEVMQNAYPCFVMMEQRGMCMDRDYMLEVRRRLQERIPVVNKKLCEIWKVPLDFKFGSTKVLGLQIEKMGWPKVEESKAGNYATNDDCIKEWKRQKQPGINELIELRLLTSILGTFIGYPVGDDQNDAKGWEYFITYHPEDNSYRVHQSYQIMGTTTYRCIGNDPNLQNVPVHAEISNEVKRCITVPTALQFTIEDDNGNVYVGGDQDTIEVEGKGRITLDLVEETDNIIPNTFEHFTYEHQECFEELKDENFAEELIREYGDISNEWRKKYGGELLPEEKVTTRTIRQTQKSFNDFFSGLMMEEDE